MPEFDDSTEVSAEFFSTARRVERVDGVLAKRQPSLTVVLEDVHDPHNASAVLRSCDAVGVLDVHLVYVHEAPPRKSFGRTTSASAVKWLRLHWHDSIDECFAVLRKDGFRILATALADRSVDLFDADLTMPTALVFGNEKRGVSQETLDGADGTISIPMMGMVESLNISVSCAVTLYEAMRQRREAGLYDRPQLDEKQRANLTRTWLKR